MLPGGISNSASLDCTRGVLEAIGRNRHPGALRFFDLAKGNCSSRHIGGKDVSTRERNAECNRICACDAAPAAWGRNDPVKTIIIDEEQSCVTSLSRILYPLAQPANVPAVADSGSN